MFKIKITYKTGGSFRIFEEIDFLEPSWKNLEIAEENVKRIIILNKYIDKYGDNLKGIEKLPKFINYDIEYDLLVINIKLDNNEELQVSPFWIGYFETLIDVEICVQSKFNEHTDLLDYDLEIIY